MIVVTVQGELKMSDKLTLEDIRKALALVKDNFQEYEWIDELEGCIITYRGTTPISIRLTPTAHREFINNLDLLVNIHSPVVKGKGQVRTLYGIPVVVSK